MQSEKNVFIIGSKGIPAKYGGFETFVENLTLKKVNKNIKYHVACMDKKEIEFKYNDARCFTIRVPNIGPAKAVYYDIMALRKSIRYIKYSLGSGVLLEQDGDFVELGEYIKENNIENAIVYILACRIGPFIGHYKKKLHKLGAKLYVNPDGHEWKRAKWNALIKKYWKLSERLMVKHADLLICDSLNIEKYIKEDYKKYNPNTTFIAYGADITKSKLEDNDQKIIEWYIKKAVKPNEYYLVVGRFVPENNFETMIKEFMKSKSQKDLVLITNHEGNKFYDILQEELNFKEDNRIKFVGTVYDTELLKKIRENAYAYLHGHSVGGTNPSLIEALATTKLNLLYDVGFNREVGENGALYWNLDEGNLAQLIDACDKINNEKILELDDKSSNRVKKEYSWEKIISDYEKLFEG